MTADDMMKHLTFSERCGYHGSRFFGRRDAMVFTVAQMLPNAAKSRFDCGLLLLFLCGNVYLVIMSLPTLPLFPSLPYSTKAGSCVRQRRPFRSSSVRSPHLSVLTPVWGGFNAGSQSCTINAAQTTTSRICRRYALLLLLLLILLVDES